MAPVLLIDEIDRADDEFEAFLLELLSDFQVTIPELGTIEATRRPVVFLTSNRTRELHDALKRRCLYMWVSHPELQREIEIVRTRVPDAPERLAAQAAAFVHQLRDMELAKVPGVAETIEWTQALLALGQEEIETGVVDATLGSILKYHEDIDRVRDADLRAHGQGGARLLVTAQAGDALVRKLVVFGRILREAGVEVGPGRLQAGLIALDSVDLRSRDEVYYALACTLVAKRDDLEIFDLAFRAWFERAPTKRGGQSPLDLGIEQKRETPTLLPAHAMGDEEDADEEGEDGEDPDSIAAYSSEELLRQKDFAAMTTAELTADPFRLRAARPVASEARLAAP